MDLKQVINILKNLGDRESLEGMQRFGIKFKECFGVRIPVLRKLSGKIKINHELAIKLWNTDIHDAKILATMIADPGKMTSSLMEEWVAGFYSWDICDQCCKNIFKKTRFAGIKAVEWSSREEEYVKRAGFVMMAEIAVHNHEVDNSYFETFFPIIKKESTDERNFVKKAVNWALRQIGKRNAVLRKRAMEVAEEISKINSKTAKWIAKDAIRELKVKSEK
jgi:3-methyladenine DNA glycosylase AlkD